MKKTILAVTLLVFGTFNNFVADAAQTPDIKKEAGYISLNKSAIKEVEPNIARITFAVENTANDVKKATTDNATVSNVIVNAIKPLLTNERDTIKTSNFSVNPVYVLAVAVTCSPVVPVLFSVSCNEYDSTSISVVLK